MRHCRIFPPTADHKRPSVSKMSGRAEELHLLALPGRVEDWRAGLGRSLCSLLSRPFVCECHSISTVPRFQPPTRRTQHADFSHYARLFASPQGLWDLSCWGDVPQWPKNLVAVVQPQRFVQPLRTPPLPAEALAVPGPRHVAPDLLFHPVFNEAEALAGISHREVSHPTAKHWIDQLNDPIQRLRLVAAEYVLEFPQQRRSFLELGCVLRTPHAPKSANASEVETQEAEALASTEVYVSTLLFINLDLQFGQLLPKPFLYRPHQPVMSRVGVNQDHQIIRKSCVLDVGVLAVARGLFRLLQHPVDLGEVEVTEQW